ncbi:Intradiol ring-cleavage dioxygenase [Camillea tinctor]|nr:Intradiol ring-cleavage dioxygenase [Camillea tinctor]
MPPTLSVSSRTVLPNPALANSTSVLPLVVEPKSRRSVVLGVLTAVQEAIGCALQRDTDVIANTTHYKNIDVKAAMADPHYVFFGETQCTVLNPEGEVGPFYVLGEYVRDDLRDGEAGIDMIVETQVLDVATCSPLVGSWVDIWNANTTGVYSGVQSSMNLGNPSDASNLNNTALRGIQQVDEDGVAKFTTKFPGHYDGRATHMHVVVHTDATEQRNGTITGGKIPHIGQLFWDQDLITEIEALSPYNENTADITLNANDHVFGAQETEGTTSDPVFNYVYLGDDVTDGLFAWVVLAVNSSATYDATYSFALTSGGGVAVEGGGSGVSGLPSSGFPSSSAAVPSSTVA